MADLHSECELQRPGSSPSLGVSLIHHFGNEATEGAGRIIVSDIIKYKLDYRKTFWFSFIVDLQIRLNIDHTVLKVVCYLDYYHFGKPFDIIRSQEGKLDFWLTISEFQCMVT